MSKHSHPLHMRLLTLAISACLASSAWANPNGATVTHGSATLSHSGGTLTVTNSPNTIINWHDFSIGTGETTRFIQQSSTSAVLNRVTGGDASLILGTLQSNGRVFLINPAGIIFGAGSVVDVGGLVASTLNITDEDFLAGKHIYNANVATAGQVVNAGEIRTPNGGFVYLIGPQVENSGIISTPGGEAILAAGNSVELVDSTDPALRVVVRAQSQDVNLSQLMVENNGNIFSVLNSGRVSANTVTQDATGRIYFKSAGNIETTATSVLQANGDATMDGGYIQGFAAGNGSYQGSFEAYGRNGGFLETSAAYLDITNIHLDLRSLSEDGIGGHWLLDPFDFTIGGAEASTISTALNSGTSVTIDTNFSSGTGAAVSGSAGTGNITVNSNITKTGGGNVSLTLKANNDITLGSGISIESTSGTLNITLNADTDGNGSGSISLLDDIYSGITLDANGGNIVLGGGINPAIGLAESITLDNAYLESVGGNVIINGRGVYSNSTSILAENLTINAGTGTLQLIGDGSGDVDFNIGNAINLRANATVMSNQMDILADDIAIRGALSLTSSSIIATNNLAVTQGGNLTMTASTIEAQGTSASFQVGNVFMDDDALIEASGNLSLNASGSFKAINNSEIQAVGNLNLHTGSSFTSDSFDVTTNGSTQFTIGGNMNVTNTIIFSSNDLTIDVGGAMTLTNSTLDTLADVNMNVGSLTMNNGTIGDSSVDNINIVSGGNVILNNGSDIVADQEISLQVGGKLYLNKETSGTGGSHISTFSDNTIFLYFPTLFSGGYILDGVEGVVMSPFNQFTGFFTGTSLDTPAILNTNLFVTYAPAAFITGIVGQTTTTSQVTNPYLDPYGTGQTGPGDSSYPSEVNGFPFPSRMPFSEVRECS